MLVVILTFLSETDRQKFDAIFDRYKNLMLYKAYQILKDARLSEDAASEAFIRIYKNMHKIADVDANQTLAFIVTIVKNTALTIYQKEKKHVTAPYDVTYEDSFQMENHVLSEIAAERIIAMLDDLSESYRQVFLMKFAHNLSHREIAGLLHMTENNVTVTLHRAKKSLMSRLLKEGYVHEKAADRG